MLIFTIPTLGPLMNKFIIQNDSMLAAKCQMKPTRRPMNLIPRFPFTFRRDIVPWLGLVLGAALKSLNCLILQPEAVAYKQVT